MRLLDRDIKKIPPVLCTVDPAYEDYMRRYDYRISKKKSRPFVGLAVRINDRLYVIPLTTQTTDKRVQRGKRKRSPLITTFIKSNGEEIANLLHNNMFPVPDHLIQRIDIDPLSDTFLANEERYIRKHWTEINYKSIDLYTSRYDILSKNYRFLQKTCCDFKVLDAAYDNWISLSHV